MLDKVGSPYGKPFGSISWSDWLEHAWVVNGAQLERNAAILGEGHPLVIAARAETGSPQRQGDIIADMQLLTEFQI